jgi:membrane-associated phospholipid phosphatase
LRALFFYAVMVISLTVTGWPQATSGAGCWAETKKGFWHDTVSMVHGYQHAPARAVATHNLKWELPIAAATAVMIAWVDGPASNRIRSKSVDNATGIASNVALGSEMLLGGMTYAIGCKSHDPVKQRAGLNALSGFAYALGNDLVLKAAFNRQYPFTKGSNGEFWEGGKSFPSGHAAASWGLASALARRYPHQRALTWTAYSLAAATSMLRFPAKRHYPSDILVGATLGYVVGSYLGSH